MNGWADRRRLAQYVPAAVTAVALVLFVPVAAASPLLAAVLLAMVVVVIVALALGAERSAVLFLAIALGLAPMDRIRPVPALDIVAMSDAFLFLGVMLLVPVLMSRRLRPDPLFVLGVAATTCAALLAITVADSAFVAAFLTVRLLVGALLLPVVFMWWAPGANTLLLFAGAYVAGNTINVIWAVTGGVRSNEGRVLGFSSHVNVVGLCAMLALALIPVLFANLPLWRIPLLFAGALCALGVWESGSRAALVVAVAIGGLYPLLARSIETMLTAAIGGVIGLYVIINALTTDDLGTNTLGRLLGGGSATYSDLQREMNAAAAWQQINDHPFLGVGLSETTLDTHNIYLQLAQVGGVVMLASFLILLASVVRRSFVLGRRWQLVALAPLAYVLIGPLTPILWERYVWCVMALPFLVSVRDAKDERPAVELVSTEDRVDS